MRPVAAEAVAMSPRTWIWPPLILSLLLWAYLLWTRLAASPRPFLYAPF